MGHANIVISFEMFGSFVNPLVAKEPTKKAEKTSSLISKLHIECLLSASRTLCKIIRIEDGALQRFHSVYFFAHLYVAMNEVNVSWFLKEFKKFLL